MISSRVRLIRRNTTTPTSQSIVARALLSLSQTRHRTSSLINYKRSISEAKPCSLFVPLPALWVPASSPQLPCEACLLRPLKPLRSSGRRSKVIGWPSKFRKLSTSSDSPPRMGCLTNLQLHAGIAHSFQEGYYQGCCRARRLCRRRRSRAPSH